MRILKKQLLRLTFLGMSILTLSSCGEHENSSLLLAKQFTDEAMSVFFNENIRLDYIEHMRKQEPNALFGGKEWRAWLKGHLGALDFIEAPEKHVVGMATGSALYQHHKAVTLNSADKIVRSKVHTKEERWSLFKQFRAPKTGFLRGSTITVSDPKNGFIQFTDNLTQITEDLPKSARIIFILSALVHEARHFGGYGNHYGLPHAICPPECKDQTMRGLHACDDSTVGPYGTEAHFMSYLLHAWSKGEEKALFSEEALQTAQGILMRSISRVLSPKTVLYPPENLEDHLHHVLQLK